jgi:hypothetical protein
MTVPKFPNLEKFAHVCINNNRDTVIVNKNEAKGISNEYTRMLEYIVDLQNQVIILQDQAATITKVEFDGGNFN